MKRKYLFSIVFAVLFVSVFVVNKVSACPGCTDTGTGTASSVAGSQPTATGNSQSGGVGSVLSKYATDGGGAAWVYYAWPAGANSVNVSGSDFSAARGFSITGNDAATCKDAGGYFVHGLISKKTHKQVGALSIGNNYAAPEWNSVRFGGQTQYHTNYSTIVGGTGVSWEQAEAAWNDANARYNFPIPWNETAWFCSTYTISTPDPIPDLAPNSNDTQIFTHVKIADRPFDSYSSVIYAGVGQTVRFRHVYYPNVQKYANLAVTKGYNGSDPSSYLAGLSCKTLLPYSSYSSVPQSGGWADYPKNSLLKNVVPWQNQFVINRNFASQLGPYGFGYGDSSPKPEYDDVTINAGNVNGTLVESATTGYPTTAWRKENSGPINWTCTYTLTTWEDKCVANCPDGYTEHREVGGHYETPTTRVRTTCRKRGAGCPSSIPDESCCAEWNWQDIPNGNPYWVPEYEDIWHAPITTRVQVPHKDQKSNPYTNKNSLISYGTNGTTTTTSAEAKVLVPMNYSLSSDIDLGSGVAYAGELLSVGNARVYNNARYNGVTGSTYATNAYGKYKLISYTSNRDETGSGWTASGNVCAGKANCIQGAESDGFWINAYSSYPVNGKFGSINIPDIPAGNYICIALAYWPTDSGDYTNMGNYNGNGVWGVSNPACRVIAKKPTFQVWGGSLYTAGALSLPAAYKTSLAGVAGREYTINGRNNVTVFSSWVDQTVSGAKTVAELASGAATTGGSYEGAKAASGYCTFRTPLSLANWANNNPKLCPTALYTGSMPSSNVIDRKALAESLAKGNANVSTGTINLNNAGHYTTVKADSGRDVRYSYRSTGLTLQGGTVNAGVTHVVRSDADVVITGNIEYQNIAYSKLEQIPKLVIYAKNIKINCGVKRVDAVLLAENEINTCADSTDVNAQKNSNQLKINGIIVTNKLKLNRTYGAATGVNSAVPAEIIDYDTSLILWAAASATVSGSNNFNVTYQRELAPRY